MYIRALTCATLIARVKHAHDGETGTDEAAQVMTAMEELSNVSTPYGVQEANLGRWIYSPATYSQSAMNASRVLESNPGHWIYSPAR